MEELHTLNVLGPHVVKIYVHSVKMSNCSIGHTDEAIRGAIDRMRSNFKPHGILFSWDCEVLEICNDSHPSSYVANFFGTSDYHNDGIDIYIYPNESLAGPQSGTSWGQGASFYDNNAVPQMLFIAGIDGGGDYTDNTPIIETNVLSHEMGHLMGLLHTITHHFSEIVIF